MGAGCSNMDGSLTHRATLSVFMLCDKNLPLCSHLSVFTLLRVSTSPRMLPLCAHIIVSLAMCIPHLFALLVHTSPCCMPSLCSHLSVCMPLRVACPLLVHTYPCSHRSVCNVLSVCMPSPCACPLSTLPAPSDTPQTNNLSAFSSKWPQPSSRAWKISARGVQYMVRSVLRSHPPHAPSLFKKVHFALHLGECSVARDSAHPGARAG